MPDTSSIIATLAAIKHSIDVVKAVKDADYDLDKAILKEKIAVLVDSLLDAKIQANETLDLIQEKDEKISLLEKALELKPKLARKGLAYYEIDENGNAFGDPFCSHCWEVNYKAIHLHRTSNGSSSRICPLCKNIYEKSLTHPISKN